MALHTLLHRYENWRLGAFNYQPDQIVEAAKLRFNRLFTCYTIQNHIICEELRIKNTLGMIEQCCKGWLSISQGESLPCP